MQELVRVKNGITYTCKPNDKGVYYIHWTEKRRSKRTSTGQREVGLADAAFDEWLKLQGQALEGECPLTCAELWTITRGDAYPFHKNNIMAHFGDKKLAEVTDDLEDEYVKLRSTGRIGTKPAAASSIAMELALLRGTFTRASQRPFRVIAPTDIPRLQPLPQPSNPRERWLTEDEIVKLLKAARGYGQQKKGQGRRLTRAYRFVWLLLETAGRRVAVEELTWAQVDFEAGVIHLNPEGREQTRKKRASVPITDTFRPILLQAYRERISPWVLDKPSRNVHLVPTLAQRAGITHASAHTLRHTAATRMARNGVPLWIIANVLGNTISEVEKTYAKFQPGFAKAHMDDLPTSDIVDALNAASG